jgi:hypothetical protein
MQNVFATPSTATCPTTSRAPVCFWFVLELIAPPQLVALPNEPFVAATLGRMARDKISLKNATSANNATERMVRINADSDMG